MRVEMMSRFHSNSWRYSVDLKGIDGDKSGDNVFFMCFSLSYVHINSLHK